MQQGLVRVWLALCFVGAVGLAIGGNPTPGAAGDPVKQYFPVMNANMPAQTDPDFRNYVGVGVSDADGDSEIYTIRGDSSDLRQLTNNEVTDRAPSFSPNGAYIVLTRMLPLPTENQWNYQLVLMNRDGSDARVLLEQESGYANLYSVKWSPRGEHMLVFGNTAAQNAIWLIGVDGVVEAVSPDSNAYGLLTWSPDGKYYTYTDTDGQLRVVTLATGAMVTIGTEVSGVWWAPDSRELLIRQASQFYLVMPTGEEMRLAFTGDYAFQGWIANGRELLLKATTPDDPNFYTLPREGGVPVALTTYTDFDVHGAMDENQTGILYYTRAYIGGEVRLYWLDLATRLPRFLQELNPGVGAGSPVLSRDNSTLRYGVTECESRFCYTYSYKVNLEDAAALPVRVYAPTFSRYLPLSSNRAAVQYGGYPGYEKYTIEMVQMEPLTITPLAFPTSPYVRYIAEWKYLP